MFYLDYADREGDFIERICRKPRSKHFRPNGRLHETEKKKNLMFENKKKNINLDNGI